MDSNTTKEEIKGDIKTHTLQSVVTTATGKEHLQKDAPASITIITQEEIESKPHKDLAEVLSGIPGIDIGGGMGRSGNAEISVRGMPSDYTLVLIDGKRQSVSGAINTFNNGYQQINNGFLPPLNAIERIEIIWYAYMQDLIGNPSTFSQHTISLFAENEWEARDNLKLTLALREDYNSRLSFHTTPKAYIVYEPLQDWLTIKWGIASGYKASHLNELVDGAIGLGNQGSRVTIGNPNLKPETSLSQELTLLSGNDYVEMGATYFYTFFWDKITNVSYTKDSQICTHAYSNACARRENVDKSSIQGLELFLSMKPIYNIAFDMNYTFTHSNQLSGSMQGYPLENMLAHLFHSKLSWDYKNLHVYMRTEAQAGRFRGLDPSKNPVRYSILGNYYKPFFLMHLGGLYRFNKNLKVGFAIYNLFDINFIDFRHADFYPNASTKKGLPYFLTCIVSFKKAEDIMSAKH